MLDVNDEHFAARILGVEAEMASPELFSAVFRGKRVLITGAAGSIGSAQAAFFRRLPLERLTLLDTNEAGLVKLEWSMEPCDPPQRTVCADIRDRFALERCFDADRPDVVVHAAALKHLPLLERHPREAALTNIIGTRNVMAAAEAFGSTATLLVSTDKAVNPTTLLGLSKRIAEGCCQWQDLHSSGRFVPVRLGNVFGSSGSVVPLFLSQIVAGRPVTLTDPRMKRYFMTGGQVVRALAAAAAALITGDGDVPRSCVLLPDLGAAHLIRDIAANLIRASGTTVPIQIVGQRPGEQLEERKQYPHERLADTGLAGLSQVSAPFQRPTDFESALQRVEHACQSGDDAKLRRATASALALLQPPVAGT